ncbi:hypothetical protein [Streptomyces panaciradicis]|uniref:hypothetical protein n=1 Tax=Streptomyces panaciradicis TaxID=1470261 RepID=UPI00201CEE7E|nr:hypothetical protein [Streptomyces panaciradicis]MCL6672214.1 hypothetical protein [Streptomyces panaciradicis]
MPAFALCWQLVFGLIIDGFGARSSGTLIGAAILPDRVSFTETLRSARRSVTLAPGSFSP